MPEVSVMTVFRITMSPNDPDIADKLQRFLVPIRAALEPAAAPAAPPSGAPPSASAAPPPAFDPIAAERALLEYFEANGPAGVRWPDEWRSVTKQIFRGHPARAAVYCRSGSKRWFQWYPGEQCYRLTPAGVARLAELRRS